MVYSSLSLGNFSYKRDMGVCSQFRHPKREFLMSDVTDDLFSEIQEELRQEKAIKFWKTYHKPLLIGVLTVVAGIVVYSSWTQHAHNKAEEAAAELIEVAHVAAQGDTTQAFLRLIALERNTSRKASYIATIVRCSITLESASTSDEEKAQAFTQLYELAKNKKLSRIWADLALLKAVYYALATSSQTQHIEEHLADLSAAGRPYRAMACELSAVHALQKGDKAKSRALFEQILEDAGASPSMKDRATLMLQGPDLRS
jgi:hypothetical protein